MAKLSRTSRADQDLVRIWSDIAIYDERAADRAMDLIRRRCEVLLRFPRGGEACPQFGIEVRWYPAGNYVIFYRPDDEGIQVLRVIDGRRDLNTAYYEK
jgi:toxin ParE1/3/4